MSLAVSRTLCRVLSRQTAPSNFVKEANGHAIQSPWFVSALTLKTSAPLSAEPRKKKKVDHKRDSIAKERLRKKLKKMEKVPPEFIPIEDFITPFKCRDEMRVRPERRLPFEESERRALLLKEWSRYKLKEHVAETEAIEVALEAQREALVALKMESEELYQAALKPDPTLFPFHHEGPSYTPSQDKYEPPEGKYHNITKVYTQ